jgi:TonB family protein
MKAVFTAFSLLCYVICGFAQPKQTIHYFKADNKPVKDAASAYYRRIITEPDSGSKRYRVQEFYKNDKPKLSGYSTSIYTLRFDGICTFYYPSGITAKVNHFKDGDLIQKQQYFYPNGKLYQELTYPDSADNNNNAFDGDYLINAAADSTGTLQVVNGTGYYKAYDDSFSKVTEEGAVINGKRNGDWKGTDKELNLTYQETYTNGDLTSGTSTDKNGKTYQYTKIRKALPQYNGGLKAFHHYLSKAMQYPASAIKNDKQGMVLLSFVVEKDGTLSSIKVVRSVSADLDKEAVRVCKSSPLWLPGSMYGRTVRVQFSVPVVFQL